VQAAFTASDGAAAWRPGVGWVAEAVRSVGTPGPAVDPFLSFLVTALCIALLVFGVGALLVLNLSLPLKSAPPPKKR